MRVYAYIHGHRFVARRLLCYSPCGGAYYHLKHETSAAIVGHSVESSLVQREGVGTNAPYT